MRPPDAVTGWDEPSNAELYDRFTRQFPFYRRCSRDLTTRADLSTRSVVLDLCGGTGVTAEAILDVLPADGRVLSVDASPAMQAVGRRSRPSPRIEWICARAEDVDQHLTRRVDAVLCNAGIWKTDTTATFAAIKRVLHPAGLFVFNVGGGFAGLSAPPDTPTPEGPSLNDLIQAIAARRYGYTPVADPCPGPVLTETLLRQQLHQAGFTVTSADVVTQVGTIEEKRAWLSIPLFARPAGALTHRQRMDILDEAYRHVDANRPMITRWLVVRATSTDAPAA